MKSTTQILRASLAAVLFSVGPVLAMAATESPVHATPMAATSSAAVTVKKVVKIIGNSETKKCHKPSCELVKKMNKENRVEFASLAEAKKAGYEPCQVCLVKSTAKKAATSNVVTAVKTQAVPVKTQ